MTARSLRAALCALVLAGALVVNVRSATADLPTGRIGAVGGLRFFQGDADQDYPTNFVYGFEGGYHPGYFGIHSTLLFGNFDTSSETAITSRAFVTQLSFSGRFTLGLGEDTPLYASAEAGVDLMRSSEPMPVEDGSLSHFGPGLGLGLEAEIAPVIVAFSLRYSVIGDPTQGLTVLFSVGSGR